MSRTACCLLATVLVSAMPAQAQEKAPRGYVSINGGYQVSSSDLSQSFSTPHYGEEQDIDAAYSVPAGLVIDAGGGFTVWKNLALGVGVTSFSATTKVTVSASIPHPFFFDRDRVVSGEAPGAKRTETGIHVQAVYLARVSRRIVLIVSGGPTWFTATQTLVDGVTYSQSYPYDSASFSGAVTRQSSGSKLGFNVGGDVVFMFSKNVGFGAVARLSRATVPLSGGGDTTVSVTVGGGQIGGGLRVVF